MHGAITTTTALHESIYAAISSVSQGPCLQLLYHRIRFLSLENGALLHSPSRNHKQGISCITQWARCKESCGCKSANVQMGKGPSSRKGRPQGRCPLLSLPLYQSSLSKSKRTRAVGRSMAGWSACCNGQITVGSAVSPSFVAWSKNRLVKHQAGGWDM